MSFGFLFNNTKPSKNKHRTKRSNSGVDVNELGRQVDSLIIDKNTQRPQLVPPIKINNGSSDFSAYDDNELKTPLVEEIRERYGEIKLSESMALVNITKSLKPTFYFGRESKKEACAIKFSPQTGRLVVFIEALEKNSVSLQDHSYCKKHREKLCKTLQALISLFNSGTQVEMIIAAASNKGFSKNIIRLIRATIDELDYGSDSDSSSYNTEQEQKQESTPKSSSISPPPPPPHTEKFPPKAKLCPFCVVQAGKNECLDIIINSVTEYQEMNPHQFQRSSSYSLRRNQESRTSINSNKVEVTIDNDVSDCE